MKKIKSLVYCIFVLAFATTLFSCATNKASKEQDKPTAPEKIIDYPAPKSNIPELVNTKELSLVPKQTEYEQIYVKLFLPERPEENLVDIYIFDKQKNKYVCCIKRCYFDTIQQENFTGLGVLWSTWAKQNAYYLIDLSRYVLLDENGNEYK